MKQTLTNFLILAVAGLMFGGMVSCRKDSDYVDIKTFDQQQIQAYIQANNLTGYTRDLSGGDTTGIYYKLSNTGSGTALDYSDLVFYLYSATGVDGKYSLTDTIASTNRSYNYVGHVTPNGLQLAIKNIFKYRGAQGHVIIPSHLLYGQSGFGTGSTRIPGNESIDFYVNMVDPAKQAAYDDITIQKYIANNSLTGFTKTSSGLYYKITQVGYGKTKVTANSTVNSQYLLKLMNNVVIQDATNADTTVATPLLYANVVKGVQEGYNLVTAGARISLIIPSALAYGVASSNVPPNSCLYFDFYIQSIVN